MVIHVKAQTGETLLIQAVHVVQVQRTSIGKNDAGPDCLNPLLAVTDVGAVEADQSRALWNQQKLPARRIVDILSDQGADFAGQIRVESLFKHGRNVPT